MSTCVDNDDDIVRMYIYVCVCDSVRTTTPGSTVCPAHASVSLVNPIFQERKKRVGMASGKAPQEEDPLSSVKLSSTFLILSERLEQLKVAWARIVLNLKVDTTQKYRTFMTNFERHIVQAVVQEYRSANRLPRSEDFRDGDDAYVVIV